MTQVRSRAAAASFADGRVFVTGGSDAGGVILSSTEIFTLDGSFVTASPMSEGRTGHAAIALTDGRVLVTGGTTAGGITNSAEIYDPVTGSWSSAGAMAESRSGHTASPLPDGTVLLAGGQNSSGPSSTLEIFDPTAATFAYAGNLKDARQNHAAATLQDGRILLVGGTGVAADGSATVLKSAEIYDPVLEAASSASPLNIARASHSLTTLVDGTVVAIGGNDGASDLASAEVYQPASDSWQLVSGSALATARSQHLALLLPKNNGVLIAGGKSSGADLSVAEIFQSWTATFQATGSMSVARSGVIGSALTQDGVLLVAGGSNQASGEVYGFATVKTDKSDYSPGQTVTITGKGWQPGETVTLLLREVPVQHAARTLSAVADAFGNFQNTSFQPEIHDLDVRFFMTVTGARSQAQITFTDAGPLHHFDVTAPATATANNGFNVTVKAKDSGGSNVTTYTGTVHFTSSDPQAVLPADYTFVAADNGSHNFNGNNVKLKTAGSQTITVTDTSDGTKFGSASVTVSAAAAKQLLVSGLPSSISAGTPNDVTVTAQDNFGNVATGYAGTVHFTSSDSQAGLPADYTFVAADNGAHIFSLGATLRTAGTQSITATDTVTASINGSQTGITVTSSTASTLAVSGYPATTNAGDGNKLTVTAKDSFGNTATGYTGTVHFTSSDPQANLPSDYTFTTGTGADNGVHLFNGVKLKTAGSQSITATDTVTATITGTQSGITVNPGPAKVLSVAGFPSAPTAGTAQNFAVTAQDQFGNTATAYTGTVHFTSSDAQAVLPADYTFVAGDNGVHSFTATLKTAAAESLTATDTVTATITGVQTGIAVNPAAAASFTLTYVSPTVAGNGNQLSVAANDAYGNTATEYLGTVHFTSSDAQANLPADYTFLTTDKGTTKLNQVKLKTVGTQSITATDTVTATITGTVSGITVTPGPAKVLAVSGYPSPATAGTSNNFTVTAQDNFGNTASGYTGTVHFTSSDAQAVLPADYTFDAGDNSVHSFSATLKTAASQTIIGTDTVTATITGSQSVTVNAAAASTLTLAFPTPTVAGDTHNLTVTAQDPYGNTATGYAGTVHFTSSDPQAALPADYTFVPATDTGTHKFNNTKLKTVGTQSFTATDTVTATITGTVAGITVTPGPAKILIVSGYASPATAGTSNNFTVTAQDNFGNTATGYTGTVHFTSSDTQAVLPADYTFVPADTGGRTFSAAMRTVGTQSITATDTVTATITGTQGGIVVTGAAAATLSLTFPTPVEAGVGNRLTVAAKDAFGNIATGYVGTVHFTSSDAQANLPADYTFVAGDAGTHNFNNTKLKTAGTQSISGADTVTSTIAGAVSGIVVTGATAATLSVTGYPSPATAGVSNSFTVTALDSFGNTAAGYLGTVHFTSSDTAAVLPADYTFVAGDNSAHIFSATLITVAKQSITATDTVTATITGAELNIRVSSGPAAKLKVTGYPSPATAGVSNSFTVTAKDANGNTVAEYVGTVHFTSSDPQAVLPADYTFQAADAGAHTFSATLKTSGTQSITATDTSNPSINDTQKNIVVGGGAATVLAVSGYPSPSTAGVSSSFTVTAKDGFGNIATAYTGSVHFTSSDAQALLPADYAFQAADAGAHTFSATLKTSGTQSITATDTSTGSITGSQSMTINGGPAALLVVKGYPSPATAGVSSSFNVCAKDGFGNTATTYTGTVHFTSSDTQVVLPADYTFQAADAGVHTFSATLKTSGTQSITATDTGNGSISGTQSNIAVGGGAATVLVVSGYPSPATAGLSGSFTVTAKDGLGNLATTYTGTVHFTSSDAQAVLPPDYTFQAGDAGVHTFSATLKTTGTQAIGATDISNGSITGAQSGISVGGGAATALIVSGYPSPATAGVSSSLTVTAKDGLGNLATTYTGTVHFTSSDAQAALPPDYTFQAGDAGVHTFSATLKTSGTQAIAATDISNSSVAGTQSNITVGGGTATALIVSGYPSPATAGVSGSFTVTAKDGFGNLATTYTGTVHFTSSDAQAVLPANYTFQSGDAGVHTFSATLKSSGTQAITATDVSNGSITGAQSNIVVGGGTAAVLVVSGYPSPATAGVSSNVTVTAKDAFGNLANTYSGTVHFTSSDGQAVLPGNATLSAGSGIFAATLKTAGTQSIAATDTVTPSIVGSQSGIVVNPTAASILLVSGFPSTIAAGTAASFAVAARDPYGNAATGYRGTVHFSSSDPAAILPADYAFAAADNGVHTFSATLNTAGTESIASTDTSNPAITGSEAGIIVTGGTGSAGIKLDVTAWGDSGNAGSSVTTSAFSTTAGNELLLAFIASDANSSGVNVSGVTGGGLTWTRVQRTNVQLGTAEIWRAFAHSPLSSVSITATLSQSVSASITVASYTGVDTSSGNGASAIGALGTGNAGSGLPTAKLTTTRNGSLVVGVGNDWDNAVAHTPAAGQSWLHQYLSSSGDTFWAQTQNSPTALSGTSVSINNAAPSNDSYNLSICEILPAGSVVSTFTISGTISPASIGSGTTVTLSGAASAGTVADSQGHYSFPNLVNGTYTVTPSKANTTFTPPSRTLTVNGVNPPSADFAAQSSGSAPITADAKVFVDKNTSSTTITSPAFSTSAGNELLLALISTDATSTGATVKSVTGAGLTWVLVRRTNAQLGTAEIWRAFAASPLTRVSVAATLSQSVSASMTIMSFTGVNTSGANGAGAIGAVGSGSAASGAPSATLTTTRANSLVIGVGTDWDNAIARVPDTNQSLVHQFLSGAGDTYWVQMQTVLNAASGLPVTIKDVSPTNDRYDLSICEILPAGS